MSKLKTMRESWLLRLCNVTGTARNSKKTARRYSKKLRDVEMLAAQVGPGIITRRRIKARRASGNPLGYQRGLYRAPTDGLVRDCVVCGRTHNAELDCRPVRDMIHKHYDEGHIHRIPSVGEKIAEGFKMMDEDQIAE